MRKILMVCLGNICRSPMAEGIVRDQFAKQNIHIQVDSAGIAAYHVGEGADSRAKAELRKHSIDISKERAQKFIPSHFDEYDLIYAMDEQNYRDIISQARNKNDEEKVDMIMNISIPGENISVPDPYYDGDEGFVDVYKMIKSSAEILANKLLNKNF